VTQAEARLAVLQQREQQARLTPRAVHLAAVAAQQELVVSELEQRLRDTRQRIAEAQAAAANAEASTEAALADAKVWAAVDDDDRLLKH
jgi:predicted  nucleic acid-binding Zn-ribbon protein